MPHPRPSNSSAPPRAPRRFFPGELVQRTATQSAGDPFDFILSSEAVDRVGDIVEIDGIDIAAFRKNPIALWNHDASSPIGTWRALRKESGKLTGTLELAAPGTSPLIDRLRALIEQRVLRAVSIGFRALVAEALDAADPWGGLRFMKTELLEASLVSIPANSEALRVRGLAPHPADPQIFQPSPASSRPDAARAGAAGRQRAPAPLNPSLGVRAMPRTIAERIVGYQQRASAIDAEIDTITETALADGERDFTADEQERLGALAADKLSTVKSIETCTSMEAALAAKASPIGFAPAARGAEPRFAVKEPPGSMIGKMATVAVLSFLTGRSHNEVIAERYRDDDRVKDCWDYSVRSASAIADTQTPGWAKELIRNDVAAFIDDLATVSVFAALRSRASAPSVDFDGAGSITIPRRNKGGLGGAWVGEGGVIPVLQGSLTSVALTPTKLAGITTFSRELASATNDTIETILRNGLRDDTADVLDTALLSDDAARALVRPAGLLDSVVGTPSSGNSPEDIRADITAAVSPIIAAGGGRDIVLLVDPLAALSIGAATTLNGNQAFPELANGQLMTYPVISSLNVPAGNLIAIDAADFANGAGVPEYRVSEEATLTMASADGTAPTQAIKSDGTVDIAGEVAPDRGIKVSGGEVGTGTANVVAMSMFQQYSLALRLVLPVHWGMRRPGMIGLVTGFPDSTP